jgi:hypothetical protein
MRYGAAEKQEGPMATDGESLCHDGFPHLRDDFTTCTKSCQQPHGHRPTTLHRCADGHEWSIDLDRFRTMPPPPARQ